MKLLLAEARQAHKLLAHLWNTVVKPAMAEGKRLWIEVREETRTSPQNRKFHALCGDIAKSSVEWMGKRRDAKQWKVLLVSGHAAATKEEFEIVPGLEGEFVNLRESTALMSVARGSSLIEYSLAWCALHGVPISDPEDYRNWGLQQ